MLSPVPMVATIHMGENDMLNVLLESRASRPRRMGSTVASALLHGALIAGAVALTMPGPVDANGVEKREPPVVYVPMPERAPAPPAPPKEFFPLAAPSLPLPTITAPDIVPTTLPPIDLSPAIPSDQVVIGAPGVRTASPIGAAGPALLGAGSAIDERLVDRAPRLIGQAVEPRYPASLREAGVQGRVVVQFVVDTLGRAELGELQVIESAHPQFVESVRAALSRYRFSVGEAAGRKVRTRVQLPFDFTLVR
jgi:protein TonB